MADWADAALASEDLQLAAALEASLRRAAEVVLLFFILKFFISSCFFIFFSFQKRWIFIVFHRFASIFYEFVDTCTL